ncbi:MAG: DUF736 family protein [Alphaproteobacteria bacterium]|nr:DUF736 family protein [Alphaproteobacteria bacterium]
MFIKAHIRGGYRAAAHYLSSQGTNEVSRLVSMSDPDAKDLSEAFQNMWQVASQTKVEKPLFHFSINPFKDERLTDKQAKQIAEAYAGKCNINIEDHQHVIVEHIKDGRQHFHVMLNRVSEDTGRAIDPGLYKKKARECSREMEVGLGLQQLAPGKKRPIRKYGRARKSGRVHKNRRPFQKKIQHFPSLGGGNLDSPVLPTPINAALFPDRDNPEQFNLIWNRPDTPKLSADITPDADQARKARRYVGAGAAP